MQQFRGRLKDADRILFEGLAGYLDDRGGPAPAGGRLEVHEGGLLANHLPTDHPYRLELEDGRAGTIELTTVHATNSAGIAYLDFRLVGALAEGAVEPPGPFDLEGMGRPQRREYLVVTQRDKGFLGRFEPEKIAPVVNVYAQQGWVVRSMVTAPLGGSRDELVILLERDL